MKYLIALLLLLSLALPCHALQLPRPTLFPLILGLIVAGLIAIWII